MKRFIVLLIAMTLTTSYAQKKIIKLKEYTASNGVTYKVGGDLELGQGSSHDDRFGVKAASLREMVVHPINGQYPKDIVDSEEHRIKLQKFKAKQINEHPFDFRTQRDYLNEVFRNVHEEIDTLRENGIPVFMDRQSTEAYNVKYNLDGNTFYIELSYSIPQEMVYESFFMLEDDFDKAVERSAEYARDKVYSFIHNYIL